MRGWFRIAITASLLLAGCAGTSRNARTVAIGEPASAACSTAVASAPALPDTRTAFVHLGGSPFGVATTSDGRWSFVDELPDQVAVFSDRGFAPSLVRTITVPHDALGNSVTPDDRYLLVADGEDGATVVSVARAESGQSGAVLGTLAGAGPGAAGGATEATDSPDGNFVFVSIEYGDAVAVYNLRAALATRFRASGYVGSIPLGHAVVGLGISPGGRWLYATSELTAGAVGAPSQGTLSVISLAMAEHDPAKAVLTTVPAHCSPVRVVVAPDGRTVWVTARESDQLLAFSAAKLISDPTHALLGAVRVGEAPVGLALVDGARRVVVADSNRFGAQGARSQLSVVDASAVLAGRPAIVGTIPAGSFPREFALEGNANVLLVSNFGSDELEAVDMAGPPAEP